MEKTSCVPSANSAGRSCAKMLPPTINYEHADPLCDLDYVPNAARKQTVTAALSNSLGFGGANAARVIKKYRP